MTLNEKLIVDVLISELDLTANTGIAELLYAAQKILSVIQLGDDCQPQLQQAQCKTLLPHDLNLLEKLWYGRNPCHEANADSGEDMFWETVACVIDDYITAVNRQ